MSASDLDKLNLAKYWRMLCRMTGTQPRFVVLDKDGAAVWRSDGEEVSDKLTADTLTKAIQASEPMNGDTRCAHLDGKHSLVISPLHVGANLEVGSLAVITDRFNSKTAPPSVDVLIDSLEDLGTGITDEYRLVNELDGVADELGARYDELNLVFGIARTIKTNYNSSNMFETMVKSCTDHLNVDLTALHAPPHGLNVHSSHSSQSIHNLDLVLVEIRGDLYRFIASGKETVVLNDIDDPRRSFLFTSMPYKILATPIFEDGNVVGMLTVLRHNHQPDFTNSDRSLIEVMASQMGILMRSLMTINQMRQFTQQMAATLIEAVEAKDPYTRGHSERVHTVTMDLSRAMTLQNDELEDIYWASLLHDIGKIGIPDSILSKPARLTKDETTFVRVHPERSYEILRHIEYLKNCIPAARHHHEKFDGSGYPHGLKGRQIPLHARIISVADTYDAITSSRAYRPGRSHEVALAELKRVAGAQLDAEIVADFMELCKQHPEWIIDFNIKRDVSNE